MLNITDKDKETTQDIDLLHDPLYSDIENVFEIDYDKTFKTIVEGEIVNGTIAHIGENVVVIDIAYKSEGTIPAYEFNNLSDLKVGDKIDVCVEHTENEKGLCILSRRKAEKLLGWERIVAKHGEGDTVPARIIRKVKGGLMADIGGVESFLPASLAFLKGFGNLNALVGQIFDVKILKVNPQRRNIIVSRKDILEAEKQISKEKVFGELEVGVVRTGMVKNITDFGAFINLGGVDGLLHITDMSWGRINHPSEMLKVGDEIEVKVLSFDKDAMKVSLGLKQLLSNPWQEVEARYPVGSKAAGKVVNIVQYGVFVELEKGIEGLVHVSEMSWSKRSANPNDMFKLGDAVDVMILSIDSASQKISLGIRQTEDNPWEGIEERYAVGSKVKGKVWNLTDFGAFVQVEDGIDGLIHISDMSWTKKITHPKEALSKGDEVQAVVLNVDQIKRKLSLGLKQLDDDPWIKIAEKYVTGSVVEGVVTKTATFGIFVEIEKDIEGLLHISEMEQDSSTDLEAAYPVGTKLAIKVLKIDPIAHKIALSLKGVESYN